MYMEEKTNFLSFLMPFALRSHLSVLADHLLYRYRWIQPPFKWGWELPDPDRISPQIILNTFSSDNQTNAEGVPVARVP